MDEASVDKVDRLKIFVSWSGDLSQRVGDAIRKSLDLLGEGFDPWTSVRDIHFGDTNIEAIRDQLGNSHVGIFILTRENQHADWINYEAGALSMHKGDLKRRVVPLLIDMEKMYELEGPLRGYQGFVLDEENWLTLLDQLIGLTNMKQSVVMDRYDLQKTTFWAEIEKIKADTPAPVPPKTEEMMRLILERVDELQRDTRVAGIAANKRLADDERRHCEAIRQIVLATLDTDRVEISMLPNEFFSDGSAETVQIRYSPEIDMTEEVRERLNKALAKIGEIDCFFNPFPEEDWFVAMDHPHHPLGL
ncbi:MULTISPECIES: toll/interleukin-1 receptor domain-containing protein [Rhodococcus]|uniref:toll/interleukin-1 receptor domain-containing protein n=1 Tax=Rhodococcus TaxID=1827 RepID=UPI00087293B5|nr:MULTISPECIES: toll/interleukin-1 receptor domain-containing protein [Rhodococcus]OFE10219.1 hypothetical protein A5N83_03650 [Rhodococcus sp. 1139]